MKFAVKLLLFSFFVSLLYFVISLITKEVADVISKYFVLGNNAIYILSRFKACEAVNIFISFWISGWIINKIINYWMN